MTAYPRLRARWRNSASATRAGHCASSPARNCPGPQACAFWWTCRLPTQRHARQSGDMDEVCVMTSVLMVSGSWPPDTCGVGDYTEVLCRHLGAAGLKVTRYGHPGFG